MELEQSTFERPNQPKSEPEKKRMPLSYLCTSRMYLFMLLGTALCFVSNPPNSAFAWSGHYRCTEDPKDCVFAPTPVPKYSPTPYPIPTPVAVEEEPAPGCSCLASE